MANYHIEIKKSAQKEISKLPKEVLPKIIQTIESLSKEPTPQNSIKLTNDEKYRIRVGNYRILYSIVHEIVTIYVVKVGHRKDVYR